MTLINILIVVGMLVCAVQAIRTPKLLNSALWLAFTSALVALITYLLGAPEIAVIELSVGAGLVTVLFVFAINIAGEEALRAESLIPKWLAWLLVIIAVILLGMRSLPFFNISLPDLAGAPLVTVLWQDRSLDLLLQVALIFAGVLGLLGLLASGKGQSHKKEEKS